MKRYLLNTILAIFTAFALLIAMLVRTFSPSAVLPDANIPNLVLFSLLVLLAEHILAPRAERRMMAVVPLSLLTFLLLPIASGMVGGMSAVKLAISGCVVFTVVTWLFTSMTDRISTGHNTRTAAIVSALGIFLASQAFSGILL